MGRTHAEAESQEQGAAPSPSAVDGTTTPAAITTRPRNAVKLTDRHGRTAYLWWEVNGPVVECEDAAFRGRVLRAIKKPIWVIEDEEDELGFPLTTRVLLQPDDSRYPSRLVWRWDQIGLDNLASVGLVRRASRERVPTLWDTDEPAG